MNTRRFPPRTRAVTQSLVSRPVMQTRKAVVTDQRLISNVASLMVAAQMMNNLITNHPELINDDNSNPFATKIDGVLGELASILTEADPTGTVLRWFR